MEGLVAVIFWLLSEHHVEEPVSTKGKERNVDSNSICKNDL